MRPVSIDHRVIRLQLGAMAFGNPKWGVSSIQATAVVCMSSHDFLSIVLDLRRGEGSPLAIVHLCVAHDVSFSAGTPYLEGGMGSRH